MGPGRRGVFRLGRRARPYFLRKMKGAVVFQDFEAKTRPQDGPPRVAALRAEMAKTGLDGLFSCRAPTGSRGEYVGALRTSGWPGLTGFTPGRRGSPAVLADVAGVFIDGRYRVQVLGADRCIGLPRRLPWPETYARDWLAEALPKGAWLGHDPWLHTAAEVGGGWRGPLPRRQITLQPRWAI